MSRTKTSAAWLHEHVTDPYVKRAKAEGYRARSAYKLIEIDKQDRLLARGMRVVDLGAVPGGWSQVAAARVGPQGRVIAVDVLEMAPLPGVTFIQGDFRESEALDALTAALEGAPVDLVLSDMAPNMSGIGVADQARVMHLCELALDFAGNALKPGGNLLVKAFQGSGYPELRRAIQSRFRTLITRKPLASRSRSSEIYLLGKALR